MHCIEDKKKQFYYLMTGTAIVVFLRALTWHLPWTRDEGIFGITAQEILKGHLPYTTIIDNKGPLLYYLYAIPLAITRPDNYVAIRFFATIMIVTGALFLFSIVKKIANERAAIFCFFLYGIATAGIHIQGYIASSELFMTLPVIIHFYFLLRETKYTYFWSGFFIAQAVLIRQTSILFFIAGLVYLLIISFKEKSVIHGRLFLYFSGFCILPALFLIVYTSKNIIRDFYIGFLFGNMAYIGGIQRTLSSTFSDAISIYRDALCENPLFFILPLISLPLFLLNNKDSHHKAFVCIYSMISLYTTFSVKFLPKNLFQLMPIWAILAAWGIEYLTYSSKIRERVVISYIAGISLLLSFFQISYTYLHVNNKERLIGIMPESFIYAEEVGLALRKATKPEDPVLSWGVEWEMQFFILRPHSMKYLLTGLLHMSFIDSCGNHRFREEFLKMQREILQNITHSPPKFIILTAPLFSYDSEVYFLPSKIEKLIETNYEFKGNYKGYRIYKLKK